MTTEQVAQKVLEMGREIAKLTANLEGLTEQIKRQNDSLLPSFDERLRKAEVGIAKQEDKDATMFKHIEILEKDVAELKMRGMKKFDKAMGYVTAAMYLLARLGFY